VANAYSFTGLWVSEPASGLASGDPQVMANISESLYARRQKVAVLELDTDSPESVSFDDMTAGVAVVNIQAFGGKVRARLTSADGSAQSLPVDPCLNLISRSVPVTALDLTRVAGAGTIKVVVFLAEKA
jgi:hypothetical protein